MANVVASKVADRDLYHR